MTRPLLATAVLALAGCDARMTAGECASACGQAGMERFSPGGGSSLACECKGGTPYRAASERCADACRSSGKRMKSHKDAFFTQGVCECEAQP